MKIIIIEDEVRTANELKSMLIEIDNAIKVEAVLGSVAAATEWFSNHPVPELIFSDIELGDGLSFEIFRNINIEAPVIFCTAFDEYAIRAFESNGIDYLLKPIDEAMLQKSLEKYLRFKGHLINGVQHSLNRKLVVDQIELAYKQTILVSYGEKIIPIQFQNVAFIYAANRLVYLELEDKRHFSIPYTLEQLEKILDPQQFFLANRNFILNRAFIDKLEYYFNRKLFITCKIESPEKIIISRVKAPLFLKWLES